MRIAQTRNTTVEVSLEEDIDLSTTVEADPTLSANLENSFVIANVGDLNTNNSVSQEVPTIVESFSGDINLHRVSKTGKSSDLINDAFFINNTVSNLVNYYRKSETYTQTEINNLIEAITSFNIEVVGVLPEVGEPNTIYFVPKTPGVQNVYDEYIWINESWELIGNTEVDLSNYLAKNNITEFTPVGDYNPSTKKYVDDSIDNIDLSNYLAKDNTAEYTPTGSYNPATKLYIDNLNFIKRVTADMVTEDMTISSFYINNGDGYYYVPETISYKLNPDSTGAFSKSITLLAGSMFIICNEGRAVLKVTLGGTKYYAAFGIYLVNSPSVDITVSTTYSYFCYDRSSYPTANTFTANLVKMANVSIASVNDVLLKTGNIQYIPTADYNPATKKYVDDKVTASRVTVMSSSDATYTIANLVSNYSYKLGEVTALTITAAEIFDEESVIYFSSGLTATTVAVPTTLINLGDTPTLIDGVGTCTASKNYIISVLNNIAVWKEY